MKHLRHFLALAVFFLFVGSAYCQLPGVNPKDQRNSPGVLQAFRSIVAKPSEATVRVYADGKDVAFGVIVEADGYILTKWDEVRGATKIVCKLKNGKELPAKVIGVKDDADAKGAYDLAMLKVDAKGLTPIEWRPSKEAVVGKWVASVGSGAEPVAVGFISVARRELKPGDQPPKAGNINSGFLGVGLADADGLGAKITEVMPKSAAEKAKLKKDDIIYEAAGRKIIDRESLQNALGRLRPNEKVLLKIKRGMEELDIEAILGKRDLKTLINPQEVMGTKLSNRRGGFPAIIQHDSGLRPEDCGGPLVDIEGKAVGINIARAGRTETYALPADDILKLLPDLKSGKLAPKEDGSLATAKDPNQILRLIASLSAKDQPIKAATGKLMKVHDVKLTAGVTYAIEMESSEIDPYLILEDANGKKLAEDDDSGGFPNAKIVFKASATGSYRIIATTVNANETGSYTLTVRTQDEPTKAKEKK